MGSNYNYDELAHLWHRFTVFGPPIDQATFSPMDFCEWLNTEGDNPYGLPEAERFFSEKERCEGTALPQAELTQEQLLTYVDGAIVVLGAETGHVATTHEIQAYLQAQFGIKEPLERIKEATDIVYEVRLKEEIEE
jgi:hypothetical protein